MEILFWTFATVVTIWRVSLYRKRRKKPAETVEEYLRTLDESLSP